eukprot:5779677-Heterocapsa_arctica.AAC.1
MHIPCAQWRTPRRGPPNKTISARSAHAPPRGIKSEPRPSPSGVCALPNVAHARASRRSHGLPPAITVQYNIM